MSFNDLERRRIANAFDAFIQTIRPRWNDRNIVDRHPFARATFVRSRGVWKIFCLRRSLKWESYEPTPTVASVELFLAVVKADKHACFFG